MIRFLLAVCALAVLPLGGRAGETVVRLNVQPMGVPTPALRYVLLPELKETNPGNPVQGYLKCFSEQQVFFFNKESVERRDRLLATPLKDLPAQELRDYGKHALRQADWAARLDRPDWQILQQLKTDGIGLLLPDLQEMRVLANALKVRFRAEVALHHYDDALRTAQTMFALARHLSAHPTLIADLVGVYTAFTAIGPLEEMLEQPGCPNLYWALTNLPSPLVPFEYGMQGERAWFPGEFIGLDDKAPMSADQVKKLIAHCEKLRLDKTLDSKPHDSVQAYLDARTKDEGLVRAARRRLVEGGFSEERLRHFPAEQVVFLDEMREYEARRDEFMKLTTLPAWQIEAQLGRIKPSKEPALFGPLVPAVNKIHHRYALLEQRIALLRHVEALRLYAADHDGRLPPTLADVAVPLPPDPFTGKPFPYTVEGAAAHLRGRPPPGLETAANFNIHFVVTVRK
jgi:hypothetical protein